MNEWTVLHGEGVNERRPDGNLDSLDHVHHRQPELTIKCVSLPHLVQRGALCEGVVRLLEWVPVCAEAVIANRLQAADELLPVRF